MTREAQRIFQEALSLPDNERADLAASLLESLGGTPDPDVDVAWREEAARRLGEIQRGEVKTVPWSEVQRRLRE